MSYHFRKAQEVILKGVRLKKNEEGVELSLRDFRYDWSNVIQFAMECAQTGFSWKAIVKSICIPMNIPIDTSNLKNKNPIPPKKTFFIGKGFNQFCRGGKPVTCLELCYELAHAGASLVFVNEKFTTKVCHAQFSNPNAANQKDDYKYHCSNYYYQYKDVCFCRKKRCV